MSGESEPGWTTGTVKVLEDEKIAALERLFASEIRRLEAIQVGQERAVGLLAEADKVETTAIHRELTAIGIQLADLRSRIDIGPVGLAALATQQAVQQGRQQGVQIVTSNLYLLLAAVGAAAGLVGHFVK